MQAYSVLNPAKLEVTNSTLTTRICTLPTVFLYISYDSASKQPSFPYATLAVDFSNENKPCCFEVRAEFVYVQNVD